MSWYSFKQLCERTEEMLRNQLPNNQIEKHNINDEAVIIAKKCDREQGTEIDDDLIDDININKLVENDGSVSINLKLH